MNLTSSSSVGSTLGLAPPAWMDPAFSPVCPRSRLPTMNPKTTARMMPMLKVITMSMSM